MAYTTSAVDRVQLINLLGMERTLHSSNQCTAAACLGRIFDGVRGMFKICTMLERAKSRMDDVLYPQSTENRRDAEGP